MKRLEDQLLLAEIELQALLKRT